VKDTNPSAPNDLSRIVRRCLAKDPDERYQSIKDVAIELRELQREPESVMELSTGLPRSETNVTTSASVMAAPTASLSSVEYFITGIKQNKLVMVIALAAIVLAGIGLSAYLHARNTEVPIRSIAVLPFINQDNNPNTEYLSEGIPEGIINSLSQLSNLKVMSRNSVFHYKGKDQSATTPASPTCCDGWEWAKSGGAPQESHQRQEGRCATEEKNHWS
jgi:serine/threonine protein kinase